MKRVQDIRTHQTIGFGEFYLSYVQVSAPSVSERIGGADLVVELNNSMVLMGLGLRDPDDTEHLEVVFPDYTLNNWDWKATKVFREKLASAIVAAIKEKRSGHEKEHLG